MAGGQIVDGGRGGSIFSTSGGGCSSSVADVSPGRDARSESIAQAWTINIRQRSSEKAFNHSPHGIRKGAILA